MPMTLGHDIPSLQSQTQEGIMIYTSYAKNANVCIGLKSSKKRPLVESAREMRNEIADSLALAFLVRLLLPKVLEF